MKAVLYWLIAILCTGVCGYALFGYAVQEPGATVHPEMKRVFTEHPWGIRLHVFGAAVALLLGPLQFHEKTRKRFPKAHQITGYFYTIAGVLVGGLAGLWMSRFAFGGLVARVGFGFLAVLWLASGSTAVIYAVKGNLREHRRWMVRNFAMTFGAVTLRIQLGLFFAAGFEFEVFYPMLAWSSWVPNLIVVEWFAGTKSAVPSVNASRS